MLFGCCFGFTEGHMTLGSVQNGLSMQNSYCNLHVMHATLDWLENFFQHCHTIFTMK